MQLDPHDCISHFCNQVGRGGNFFHSPIIHQRGYGLFQDVSRYLSPIIMRAGKYLGKHLLKTGSNVISDVASGQSFKTSTQKRLKETGKAIRDEWLQKLQRGAGIKRKKPVRNTHLQNKRHKSNLIGDIFTIPDNGKRKLCSHKKRT